MQFLAAGVIWAGYTLIYWGYCHVTGPRQGQDMTFGMLIKPGKLTLASEWMKQPHPNSSQVGFLIPNAQGGGGGSAPAAAGPAFAPTPSQQASPNPLNPLPSSGGVPFLGGIPGTGTFNSQPPVSA